MSTIRMFKFFSRQHPRQSRVRTSDPEVDKGIIILLGSINSENGGTFNVPNDPRFKALTSSITRKFEQIEDVYGIEIRNKKIAQRSLFRRRLTWNIKPNIDIALVMRLAFYETADKHIVDCTLLCFAQYTKDMLGEVKQYHTEFDESFFSLFQKFGLADRTLSISEWIKNCNQASFIQSGVI